MPFSSLVSITYMILMPMPMAAMDIMTFTSS